MKRIATLVLGAAMALGSVGAASAVDVKVAGEWDFAFGWDKNTSFQKDDNADDFISRHRVRTQVNFIASENLQGVLMFEIGDLNWGRDEGGKSGPGSGGGLDADGVNVETKLAYLDWLIPQTEVSVRMGIQYVALPSGTDFGNPVLNSDVAGITITAPINDMFGVTALWARPFDAQDSDGDRNMQDEMDLFALMLPITGDGWNVTPWGAYAKIGNASGFYDYVLGDGLDGLADQYGFDDLSVGNNDGTMAWWAGLATSVEVFDPLTFGFDVMYGHLNRANLVLDGEFGGLPLSQRLGAVETGGWLLDARLDYNLDWAVPGIFGWYSTGDDKDDVKDGEYGRMPAIGFDNGFAPTGFGAPGAFGIGSDTVISATMLGTWGIGAQLADVSFVEDLSHTLRVTYYRGTNDPDVAKDGLALPFSGEAVYMTTDDWAVEVNFDHMYQIYENLAVIAELSWIHLDMDNAVWTDDAYDEENAWKAQVSFQYSF